MEYSKFYNSTHHAECCKLCLLNIIQAEAKYYIF